MRHIFDLFSGNVSLSSYEVDVPNSLGHIFYCALRDFYRTRSCGKNKELYIQSFFSGAYNISERIKQEKRPSLHREDYERMARGDENDATRGEVMLTMVYYIVKQGIASYGSSKEVSALLEEIKDVSIVQHKDFFEDIARRFKYYRPTDKDLANALKFLDSSNLDYINSEDLSIAFVYGFAHTMAELKIEDIVLSKDLEIEKLKEENMRMRELISKNKENKKSLSVDFIVNYAKTECSSWKEAKPFYELLIEFADGNRDIKQKAKSIKVFHNRKKNAEQEKNEYYYASGAVHNDNRKLLNVVYDANQETTDSKLPN